jgi:hypothetical protein
MRRFGTSNLENLGTEFSIPITADKDGYLGRECPIEKCLGYFKITPGTGVKGPVPCHCPYCGHAGESRTFFTQEQIEYARSVVLRKVTDAIHKDLKSLEFEHKPQGLFGIGLSLKVQRSTPLPIRSYREKQLETEVVCDACTLRYAIYGVFGSVSVPLDGGLFKNLGGLDPSSNAISPRPIQLGCERLPGVHCGLLV